MRHHGHHEDFPLLSWRFLSVILVDVHSFVDGMAGKAYARNLARASDAKVHLYTISVDTPFAQTRFAREAKINNATFLSDYRDGDFGRTHGLLSDDPHFTHPCGHSSG